MSWLRDGPQTLLHQQPSSEGLCCAGAQHPEEYYLYLIEVSCIGWHGAESAALCMHSKLPLSLEFGEEKAGKRTGPEAPGRLLGALGGEPLKAGSSKGPGAPSPLSVLSSNSQTLASFEYLAILLVRTPLCRSALAQKRFSPSSLRRAVPGRADNAPGGAALVRVLPGFPSTALGLAVG